MKKEEKVRKTREKTMKYEIRCEQCGRFTKDDNLKCEECRSKKNKKFDRIFFIQKLFICAMSGYGIFWGCIFAFGADKINIHFSLLAAIIMGIATYILVDKVGEEEVAE